METRLSDTDINEGEPLEIPLEALITIGDTIGNKNAPTPIAITGIPVGLEVHHDQLKELVPVGRISSITA